MSNFNATFLSQDELARMPFAACGNNVLIDTSVRIIGMENLEIGSNVRIDAGTIIVASGPIVVGSRVHIGANSYLEGRGGIRIENFANISSYVSVHSVSDDASGLSLTNPMTPDRYKTLDIAEVVVRRHALVFTKSTLLPGTIVGEGAVIGAHSMAKGEIPAWGIYVGVPAHFVSERKRDLLALEQELLCTEPL
ncbi:MAG: acyltransferase [Rhizobiaceae bacterium]